MLGSIISGLAAFMRHNKQYITENKEEIRLANAKMLRAGSSIYLGVLIFYTVLSLLTDEPKILLRMYIGFGALQIVLCVLAFRKSLPRRPVLSRALCAAFEVSLLTFFMVEAVFPFPDAHSLYIPIAILAIILCFSHGVLYMTRMVLAYLGSYVILAYMYKSPAAFSNDWRIALATLAASAICYVILSNLRFNERRAVKELERLNMTDPLTGLYTKQAMATLCEACLRRKSKTGSAGYMLVIIDMDNFKNFNDRYGHSRGDDVLRDFAATIKARFHEGELVGRFGGDEFFALMETGADGAEARIVSIMDDVRAINLDFCKESIRCSIGGAMARGENYQTLFEKADGELYKAKNSGKNQYRISF